MFHENLTVSDSGQSRAGTAKRAARKTRRGGNAAQRASLYDEVTAQIIAQHEKGIFPWVKPWNAGKAVTGLPCNAISGRHYSGVNILILWGAVIDGGYPSQDWLTFRQALAAGGCVRKGEKGRTIFYADRFTPDDDKKQEGEGEAPRSIPFLKRFTVFNAAQCDGLPKRLTAEPTPLPERELHDQAETLIAATEADFRTGGTKAFYSPAEDYVQVPPQPAFTHQIDYYRTALHELGHWTGHKTRLGRDPSDISGPRFMRGRSYAPNWLPHFSALRLVSRRQSAMPIISALGWPYCGRTIAPFLKPPVRPARRRIIYWRSPIRCRCARSAQGEQCVVRSCRRSVCPKPSHPHILV